MMQVDLASMERLGLANPVPVALPMGNSFEVDMGVENQGELVLRNLVYQPSSAAVIFMFIEPTAANMPPASNANDPIVIN